ncbi:MAG: 3-hydroxyacyl-ACP dehydratase FabZ family protein [Thermoguttaceae bacterium]
MRWYWIDRFIEFESGRCAKAIKNISLAEEYLHDHFPGYAIMPNTLIIEGLAQTGGLLVCEHGHFKEKVVLAKVPKVCFFCEATPGDTLTYTATVEDIREDGAFVNATSYKGAVLQAQMEIVFAHLNGEHGNKTLYEPEDYLKMMRMLRAYEIGHAADGSPLVEPSALVNGAGLST